MSDFKNQVINQTNKTKVSGFLFSRNQSHFVIAFQLT
jgi:hypothetical protein